MSNNSRPREVKQSTKSGTPKHSRHPLPEEVRQSTKSSTPKHFRPPLPEEAKEIIRASTSKSLVSASRKTTTTLSSSRTQPQIASAKTESPTPKVISRQYFPVCRDFFLITGPGGTAYGNEAGSELSNAISSGPGRYVVKGVGDGASPVTLNDIREGFLEFIHAGKRKHATAKGCWIIFHGHSKKSSEGCRVKLSSGYWCPISELFDIFNSAKSALHLSIFIGCCCSNSAVTSVGLLPVGTTVIMLSDIASSGSDVQRWIQSLTGKWKHGASVLDLFNAFLIDGLRNRFVPRLSIVGVRDYELGDVFVQHLGKAVKQDVIHLIERHNNKGVLGPIARKIGTASPTNEFGINAIEYGAALALTFSERLASRFGYEK
ncbi:hypothetical protein SBOR_1174 [Sclerotinia borealis F-4128]|uniref:Uncharacterized protein n=1 Tax=Sclerotinia borealis (strain F-4128) TaxID=1432307 RepID=W9CNX2_SCLBF|nr:hypothetical protein SBOR_1174 [Sclerotinia borealis F-4128]